MSSNTNRPTLKRTHPQPRAERGRYLLLILSLLISPLAYAGYDFNNPAYAVQPDDGSREDESVGRIRAESRTDAIELAYQQRQQAIHDQYAAEKARIMAQSRAETLELERQIRERNLMINTSNPSNTGSINSANTLSSSSTGYGNHTISNNPPTIPSADRQIPLASDPVRQAELAEAVRQNASHLYPTRANLLRQGGIGIAALFGILITLYYLYQYWEEVRSRTATSRVAPKNLGSGVRKVDPKEAKRAARRAAFNPHTVPVAPAKAPVNPYVAPEDIMIPQPASRKASASNDTAAAEKPLDFYPSAAATTAATPDATPPSSPMDRST